jgi:hypothetical protein
MTTDLQPEPSLRVIPAMYNHITEVYTRMVDQAKPEDIEGRELLVYEGHLTKLIMRELRLSMPYYTSITRALRSMGCIEQIRRGGGTSPSRWVLWKEPTFEAWQATDGDKARRGNATTVRDQRVKDLHERVAKLEEIVDQLVKALIALQDIHEGKRAA